MNNTFKHIAKRWEIVKIARQVYQRARMILKEIILLLNWILTSERKMSSLQSSRERSCQSGKFKKTFILKVKGIGISNQDRLWPTKEKILNKKEEPSLLVLLMQMFTKIWEVEVFPLIPKMSLDFNHIKQLILQKGTIRQSNCLQIVTRTPKFRYKPLIYRVLKR
mgnify:CR=1 FL=1